MSERTVERSAALIVIAKEPAPGRAKTRLQQRFSAAQAATLAAASIRDTLRAARAADVRSRFLCWQGFTSSPAIATDGLSDAFEVVDQRTGQLGDRLAGAFDDAWRRTSGDAATLLIGMDTPQVGAADLDVDWAGADALLGMADDGGFWAIGLRRRSAAEVFAGVEMSTDHTGADQLDRLRELGLTVGLLPPLIDVDTPADAELIADRYPELEFSRVHRTAVAAA